MTVSGVYPSRRRSAISRRRWGTVNSIALNANRNPTSALITANSVVDWLFAAAAFANSCSSYATGSTLKRVAASAPSAARTRRCAPGEGSTRMRLTRPPSPVISCTNDSGASATGLETSGPICLADSVAYSGAWTVCPATWKVTSWPNLRTPMVLERVAGSTTAPIPPNGASWLSWASVPPSSFRLVSAPTICTDSLPFGPIAFAPASSSGAATRTPGMWRTWVSTLSGKPVGLRASSCRLARPTIPCESSATEFCRLELETSEANSSATPAAIPTTAKHSCRNRARKRTR